ncbi:hypothetical protein PHET_07619 [Paragonimus heterotremus]|uniref:Uncharacterized protein n=1 Tax=Paragonimus heterotremus TaxID=100268 RepID=A0A8J4SIJ1_9TREM|nr:hypothetical protein PHET_07619 [Paragonimus heterotremus]
MLLCAVSFANDSCGRSVNNPLFTTLFSNRISELSITGPVTADFCDEITLLKPHGIGACCLERVGSTMHYGNSVGEYRILYNESEKFDRDTAWRYLRSALKQLNKNGVGCLHNAYWID